MTDRLVKGFLLWGLMTALALSAAAAQPMWAVKTLVNIRRAMVLAQRAKTAGRAALALGAWSYALPDDEIAKLARVAAKNDGLAHWNQILGSANFIGKYGEEAGHLVLQDTYLRIAVKNGKMASDLAADTFKRLGGTPGLTSLLSKINSASFSQVKGHMRELEIALNAQKRGFSTVSLGQRFADGLKKGDTDLDVLLYRNGKNFAIESKAYSGLVPDTMVKADAESLIAFCQEIGGTVPVFCFETIPSDTAQFFLRSRGVRYFVGTPEEIVTKLDFIASAIK